MKRFLYLAFVLFSVASSGATSALLAADLKVFYVVSADGLILRAEPRTSAKKIGTLPFGGRVTAVSGVLEGDEITVGNIASRWMRIQSGKTTGYAFRGFLAPFRPLGKLGASIAEHFAGGAKLLSSKTKTDSCKITQADCDIRQNSDETVRKFRQRDNNIDFTVIKSSGYEAWSEKILVPYLELHEAYLIIKNCRSYLAKSKFGENFESEATDYSAGFGDAAKFSVRFYENMISITRTGNTVEDITIEKTDNGLLQINVYGGL